MTKPNILFFMVDQMRADAIAALGNNDSFMKKILVLTTLSVAFLLGCNGSQDREQSSVESGSLPLLADACNMISPADVPEDEQTFAWPSDPPANWLSYHLVHPDPDAKFFPGDPNPAIYYKGKYHLHYLYNAPEGGLAMAHVSSTDMIHWKWHPTVLRPKNIGGGSMLSGTAFLTKEGTPAIIFSDNRDVMIVHALDDNLDKWTKPEKVQVKGKKILDAGQQARLAEKLKEYDFSQGAGPKLKQLLMRGEILLALGRAGEALEPLRRSAEIDADRARVHFQLATALSVTGDAPGALEAFAS